jgi:hypothetical protein
MPSAAPISGSGFARVDTVSLGGTVKERVMAVRRGVACSGVPGMDDEEADIFGDWSLYKVFRFVGAHATRAAKG